MVHSDTYKYKYFIYLKVIHSFMYLLTAEYRVWCFAVTLAFASDITSLSFSHVEKKTSVCFTSHVRQEGQVQELQWNKSVPSSQWVSSIWSIMHSYKWQYLDFETMISDSSCDTSCHSYCKVASFLPFHFPHYPHESITGTLFLNLTDHALLQQYPLRKSIKKQQCRQHFRT